MKGKQKAFVMDIKDSLQAQLINMGVIPTLVKLLGIHSDNVALTEMCLIAFEIWPSLTPAKNSLPPPISLRSCSGSTCRKRCDKAAAGGGRPGGVSPGGGGSDCRREREEDVAQLKTSSDLMVLLLLGDESMQKLFEGGKGSVFQRVLSWIPSHNHQLQLAGALAIANFARNDGNCIHMVDTGIVQKLLELLDRHVDEGNVTVQHAALSALRNLAIPVVNKSKMLLSAGVADVVLKFLQSEMPPVQFKLLGTLRMLIDTQAEAADQLGTNGKLVERLVEWCEAKDHAGVMGESNRLLSALIRHSKSKEVVKTVIQGGGGQAFRSPWQLRWIWSQLRRTLWSPAWCRCSTICLSDERSAPEIKYNSMILICAAMGSEPLHKEVQSLAFIDVVSRLRAHENKTVSHQASLTEQRLTAQS
ncbi:hypothetical protein KUCAC02_000794 [Chaenocephalus aceratus]|uniref:Uncharacterized protein n=1 Tax=Chaenocephalus aceratus TaxID=36190 RepID=A0ACB9W6N1_CHAAC|nr:hypothetical protein KUCAC02_000794 [Chaenocephalus aceratus]